MIHRQMCATTRTSLNLRRGLVDFQGHGSQHGSETKDEMSCLDPFNRY